MAEESEAERRERVMRRLAEMLKGPPPSTEGGGAVAGGPGIPGFGEPPGLTGEAIAALGLELSGEDTDEVAGALREGPDPAEVDALFRAMLGGFEGWRRQKDRPTNAGTEGEDGTAGGGGDSP